MVKATGSAHVLKVGVDCSDACIRAGAQHKEILDFCRRLVGDDEVNPAAVLLQVFNAFNKLFSCGNFLVGPGFRFKADVNIGAFSSAHSENSLVLNFKYLTAHQMKNVTADVVNLTAVPFFYFELSQKVKVFVSAV